MVARTVLVQERVVRVVVELLAGHRVVLLHLARLLRLLARYVGQDLALVLLRELAAQEDLALLDLVAQGGDLRVLVGVGRILAGARPLEALLLEQLLLDEVSRGQALLPNPLLAQEVLAVELLHARGPAPRVLVAHPQRQVLCLGLGVVEVELLPGGVVQVLEAELLALRLGLALRLLPLLLQHGQLLVGLQVLGAALALQLRFLPLPLRHLGDLLVEGLLVHADGAALRVEDAVASLGLQLPTTSELALHLLLLREPGLGKRVQHVRVEALEAQRDHTPGVVVSAAAVHSQRQLEALRLLRGVVLLLSPAVLRRHLHGLLLLRPCHNRKALARDKQGRRSHRFPRSGTGEPPNQRAAPEAP
mmetsp:Transcript_16642/g.44006  ORF Transcript_16642/g.44006 Transcript_16642/m.44006 type:complete len:362 (-) Transcript_16642:13-1098(-)